VSNASYYARSQPPCEAFNTLVDWLLRQVSQSPISPAALLCISQLMSVLGGACDRAKNLYPRGGNNSGSPVNLVATGPSQTVCRVSVVCEVDCTDMLESQRGQQPSITVLHDVGEKDDRYNIQLHILTDKVWALLANITDASGDHILSKYQ